MTIEIYLSREDIDISYSTRFMYNYKKYRKLGEITSEWEISAPLLAHITALVRECNSEEGRWRKIVSFLQNLEGFEATYNFLND